MEVEQGEEGNRWKGRNRGVKGNRGTPPPPLDLVSYRNACVGGEEGAGPCVLPSCSCLAGGRGARPCYLPYFFRADILGAYKV